MEKIVAQFAIDEPFVSAKEYGSGHINVTYLVQMDKKYILQKINTSIFHKPDELMENIVNVTSYLCEQIEAYGGDCMRETLQVIPTRNEESFLHLENGDCYRMYHFITDATSYDAVESPKDFYESAVAFGNFQALLSAYPADTLYETIPDFHNTGKRYRDFLAAVDSDVCGRAESVQEEIEFVVSHASEMTALTDLLENGELPLRVTHNDTKLNNVMIDNVTGRGICVIDLDTVMPGLAHYDFGDAIRFGANTATEDEMDLSKVSLDLSLFELYAKGFLEGCKGRLTEREVEMLPMGAKLMTLECGMRFLADYLQGDTYFRIHRKHHNLDRCRTQFALVRDMEQKWENMQNIIRKISTEKAQCQSDF